MKTLDLYITKVCNLNCDYCYVDVIRGSKHNFPTESFQERINLLEYDDIKFFGGEPLIQWKTIQDIVQSVRKKSQKIRFTIVTNGVLLHASKVDFLLQYNVNIVVSIHEQGFESLKNKIEIFHSLGNNIGFYIIFDPKNFALTLKNFLYFFGKGFKNYCFAPEIYGDWDTENLKRLEKLLDTLIPYIYKFHLQISGIPHNKLKNISRGCEKTVFDHEGNFSPCNRFKYLKQRNTFNYKEVYDYFDTTIDFSRDPYRWLYICPVGWYIDNIENNTQASAERFRDLNRVFIRFYKKIHAHHITFFSDDIQEVRFNLTQQCNLRCKYCYVDFTNEVIDLKEAKNIVDYFLAQNQDNIMISFFGGEPLLEYEGMKEITLYSIERAKILSKKVNFSIATNFTIVNPEIMKFLREYDFKLHISLNGDIEHNNNSRDQSSHKVFTHIDTYLSEKEKKNTCILFAFEPSEIMYIEKNIHYLYKIGMREFNLELIFGNSIIWRKQDIKLAVHMFQRLSQIYPDIIYQNTHKKRKFIDIQTDGTGGENSLEFHGVSLDGSMKKIFDMLLLKAL